MIVPQRGRQRQDMRDAGVTESGIRLHATRFYTGSELPDPRVCNDETLVAADAARGWLLVFNHCYALL